MVYMSTIEGVYTPEMGKGANKYTLFLRVQSPGPPTPTAHKASRFWVSTQLPRRESLTLSDRLYIFPSPTGLPQKHD